MEALDTDLSQKEELAILGGSGLAGSVAPDGYKHALVLSIAASMLCASQVRLRNTPRSTETDILISILTELGAEITNEEGDLVIDTAALSSSILPAKLSQRIHGSLYLLPGLLSRFGHVTFSGAGGCAIGHPSDGGARPTAHVLEVLKAFGARFETLADGTIKGRVDALEAEEIDIMAWSDNPSVLSGPLVSGATKTALLAALQSPRPTVIRNPHDKEAARDLIRMARCAGAVIKSIPNGWVVSRPLDIGRSVVHTIMSDPTEVMTWIAAAVFTRSELTIGPFESGPVREALRYEAPAFEAMGIDLVWSNNRLTVRPPQTVKSLEIEAEVRGISTDNHPFFTLMLTGASGPSTVTDRVWHHRFAYVECLNQLGADLTVRPPTVYVAPLRPHLAGQLLAPSDTRAAAVSILGALAVDGETRVRGLSHLQRGYVRFPSKLASLGVGIMGLE